MAYAEVRLNTELLAIGGGDDISSFSLTLVGIRSAPDFWLQMSGMRQTAGQQLEHIEWLQRAIHDEDTLLIRVTDNAPSPASISEGSVAAEFDPISETWPEKALDIKVGVAKQLTARIGEHETLQLVLSWHRNMKEFKLEVDSVSLKDDGYTESHRWIAHVLQPGNWIAIRPRIGPQEG